MLLWNLTDGDPYYRGRRLEAEARRTGSAETWEDYAALKAEKGSYVLAGYGYFNAALACEQTGDADEAFSNYSRAFENARRTGGKELALMVAYRQALLAEKEERWEAGIACYEALGEYAEALGNHFLAADAYEHAAEIMVRAGKPVAEYRKPLEQWERNAEYWRAQGDEGDAAWSERHIALYRRLFGIETK